MITIDGSKGGGQILRTSLSLSALTGKPVEIKNIRGSRPNPGLKEQHLKGLELISKATEGKTRNLKHGSTHIKFFPGKEIKEKISIKINTAGSIGLILQELMILGLKKNLEIEINGGGTYVKWSPPVDYMKEVFLPLVKGKGYNGNIKTKKEGFYPKGGGRVKSKVGGKIERIDKKVKGKPKKIKIISKASKQLKNREVAERQAKAAEEKINEHYNLPMDKEISYVETESIGSGILLKCITEESVLGADSLGEKGKKSEEVGKKAAEELLNCLKTNCAVDSHMADNLVPYMGYAKGNCSLKVPKITSHVKTNIETVEKFLPVKFKVKHRTINKKDLEHR